MTVSTIEIFLGKLIKIKNSKRFLNDRRLFYKRCAVKVNAFVLHQRAVGTLTSTVHPCPFTSNLHLKEPFATPPPWLLATFWDHVYHHTWRLHDKPQNGLFTAPVLAGHTSVGLEPLCDSHCGICTSRFTKELCWQTQQLKRRCVKHLTSTLHTPSL